MNRPRRVRSPPFGYDPRMMGRADQRPVPDYDDPYAPATPFETPPQSAPAFAEIHPQCPVGYRDHRLPSTYRTTMREPLIVTSPAPYKILCITNINHKVSDGPVKDALISDFSRFGDISVSICHDSGERLAYIYFRTYEEAREARHAKARTLLFDRPIEIEPIYEPRSSPPDSPPQAYLRRRSVTPPEYYGINGPPPPQARRPPPPQPIPHHRTMSPPDYPHASRSYPSGPSSPPPAPMPYGRYYIPPANLPPTSPYSPTHEPSYRNYHLESQPLFQPIGHPYHPIHGPHPRERERPINEGHLQRSPRHEAYYTPDPRGYPPQIAQHLSRIPIHNQHPGSPPAIHHHSSSSIRRSPHSDHHRYMNRDYRREKFGGEHFSNDSSEGRPSRVIFITNIDSSKSDLYIRDIFESFGAIEEMELKKVNSEFSSALIKFSSMDCAYKAKTATNGKYLGSLKCRITYGKVSASRRLWIGGLGSATTIASLEDQFGKFGKIINLDYNSGRPYAYIEYESPNQAQFAAIHLRGTLVADADRRIRIEFVDPIERTDKTKPDPNLQVSDISSRSRTTNESWSTNELDASPQMNNRKRSISPNDIHAKKIQRNSDASKSHEHRNYGARLSSGLSLDEKSSNDKDELNNNQDVETNNVSVDSEISPNNCETLDVARLTQSKSIRDIVESSPTSWLGQLVLRNFNFPSRMYMCSGRKTTIEKYLGRLNGGNVPILRITQRWRLHPQPKLEEVKRRMQTGNLGMLIITSWSDQSPFLSSPIAKTPQNSANQISNSGDRDGSFNDKVDSNESTLTQPRPLKNLINYLEQKDAAGVISLNPLDTDQTEGSKLLYTFPPGDFAINLLRRKAPYLTPESTREEFLLGVIVAEAKV